MTTIDQARNALNDYEEWREERTLEGIDLSADAYIAHLEREENARIVEGVREILNDPQVEYGLRLAKIASLFTDQKEVSA